MGASSSSPSNPAKLPKDFKKQHEKNLKSNLLYHLSHIVPHMSILRVWQRDIRQHDKPTQKMLAIRELCDLPYEVWAELLQSTERRKFMAWAQSVGTAEYTKAARTSAIASAMGFYARSYMALHGIPTFEEARDRINATLEAEDQVPLAPKIPQVTEGLWNERRGWEMVEYAAAYDKARYTHIPAPYDPDEFSISWNGCPKSMA